MNLFRVIWALLHGRLDRVAFERYQQRLLAWAAAAHGLTPAEYADRYAGRYLDATGRDLFLDYLASCAKEQASYVTDHAGLLADRAALFSRFGHPVLTMHELASEENKRLQRMESPFRV